MHCMLKDTALKACAVVGASVKSEHPSTNCTPKQESENGGIDRCRSLVKPADMSLNGPELEVKKLAEVVTEFEGQGEREESINRDPESIDYLEPLQDGQGSSNDTTEIYSVPQAVSKAKRCPLISHLFIDDGVVHMSHPSDLTLPPITLTSPEHPSNQKEPSPEGRKTSKPHHQSDLPYSKAVVDESEATHLDDAESLRGTMLANNSGSDCASHDPKSEQLAKRKTIMTHQYGSNQCLRKTAPALMINKKERTRMWIESGTPPTGSSCRKLTRKPSLLTISKDRKFGRRAKRELGLRNKLSDPETAIMNCSSSLKKEGPGLKQKFRTNGINREDIGRKNKLEISGDNGIANELGKGFSNASPIDIKNAKHLTKNKQVVSMAVHDKSKRESPTNIRIERNNTRNTNTLTQSTRQHRVRIIGTSAKHFITMPVSHASKRWGVGKNEEMSKRNRHGEWCQHPECEKRSSPANLREMLERSRVEMMDEAADQSNEEVSSEGSVIYQRLSNATKRAKARLALGRAEDTKQYRRGNTVPHWKILIKDEDDDGSQKLRHNDHQPHYSRYFESDKIQNFHSNRKDHKPTQRDGAKRRAVLQESTSSSDSSSETLIIRRPLTPKPRQTIDVIDDGPNRKKVMLPSNPPRYSVERAEPSRFQRASARESHVRKHHAELVRGVLKLNMDNGFPDNSYRKSRARTERNLNKNNRDSDSNDSCMCSEHSRNNVKSAPDNLRQETFSARMQAKPPRNPKRPTLVARLSQRRLTSTSSKPEGFKKINVEDFVNFLVTLSRNTVGTLTNKRKAMRLYRDYLNGKIDINDSLLENGESSRQKAPHGQRGQPSKAEANFNKRNPRKDSRTKMLRPLAQDK